MVATNRGVEDHFMQDISIINDHNAWQLYTQGGGGGGGGVLPIRECISLLLQVTCMHAVTVAR